MIQLTLLRRKCIGCCACVEAAPQRWVISKSDGKAFLRKGEKKGLYYVLNVSDIEEEENQRAAKNCPVNIIKVKKL